MKTRAANWRRLQLWCALAVLTAISATESFAQPAGKVFNLGGATLSLEDATTDLGLYYTSMRFNRAANVWNVEVSLTNRSSRTWLGPVVLLVDGFSGTSGPLQPDGADEAAKPFYELSSLVLDGVLAPQETSLKRTLSIAFQTGAAPQLTTRVFARPPQSLAGLQFVRTLDEAGLPLPSVTVDGASDAVQTDDAFGLATLTQTNQTRGLRFSAVGYLPVWRVVNVSTGAVGVIPNPRLSKRDANPASLTPIAGGELTRSNPAVRVRFTPGAFSQDTTAVLTPLTGQTLPLFLPAGWSPLAAFWLELSAEPALAGNGTLTPSGPIQPGETAAFVRLNTNSLTWEVLQLVAGNGSNAVNVALPGGGAFALVVADSAPIAPPSPTVGVALAPSVTPLPVATNLRAGGTVTPSSSPASRTPELVTATAEVIVTNVAGNSPSGTLLHGEVTERYTLRDGTRRFPALFDNFVVGYQRPGDSRLDTVRAEFPIRPLLLFGAEELDEAVVRMDLSAPDGFSGGILGTNGGQVASDGLRVLAGAGDLLSQQAVQLRRLNVTNFTELAGSNASVVAAFELGVNDVAAGHKLIVQLSGLATNSTFVLARVLAREGLYGLEPRERLYSDANGNLASDEPLSGDKLPGINGAGQYVLLKINPAQGLVSGIARNGAGQPIGGLSLRIAGQPWLTFSASDGAFKLLAPAGDATVTVNDLTTGDSGTQIVNIPNPQTPVNTQLASVSSGPRVVSVTPTNNAAGVSRVTSVIVEFDKPLNPATLAAGGILLLGTSNAPVSASLTLNLRGTVATLLPANPLAANTHHTISLSTNLADISGRRLEGTNLFTFTTESDALNRLNAQLIIYEPTNGVTPVFGTPGTADPDSPVILVNETSGQTATILSRPDGSFTNFIEADVDDQLSAVIVNRNGTRNTVRPTRQLFRDGSIGLFNGGGVIEVQGVGGGASLSIEPGAIAERTRLRLEMVDSNELAQVTQNVLPVGGKFLGRALRVSGSGSTVNGAANVAFPVTQTELEQLGLPSGDSPTNATYAMVAVTKVDGQITYLLLNKLEYENGKLVTHSPPYPGAEFLMEPHNEFLQAAVEGFEIISKPVSFLLGPFDFLITPLVLAFQSQPLTFTGAVVEFDTKNTRFNPLPGAVVTISSYTNNSPDLSPPRQGRLNPGQLYTVAQKRGIYALLQPRPYINPRDPDDSSFLRYVLSATHPQVFGRVVYKSSSPPVINLSITDLILPSRQGSLLATQPPGVLVSQVPAFPPAGSNVDVTVTLTHATEAPTLEILDVDSVTPTAPVVGPFARTTEDVTAQIRREHFKIRCDSEAKVVLKLKATVLGVAPTTVYYAIRFGPEPPPAGNPDPPDKNDKSGPRVLISEPPANATGVELTRPIRLAFNEPLDRVTVTADSVSLDPPAGAPRLKLSEDQRELLIAYPDLKLGQEYDFRFGDHVTDLPPNSNKFDQSGTNAHDPYLLHFETTPKRLAPLPGIVSGAGVVVRGAYAFVLDRVTGSGDGKLVVFDISDPAHPAAVTNHVIPGRPRDLALIPSYAYRRRPGMAAETNDLLAVSFGDVGASFDGVNFIGGGQFIRIFNIGDPTHPANLVTRQVTLSYTTVVPRLRWSPPILAYLESSADFQALGLVNLQTMILGEYMTREEFNNSDGSPGADLNGDGDFVDPGEELPMPNPQSADFAGKVFSFAMTDTTQRIGDFDYDFAHGYIGAVLNAGKARDPAGQPTTNVAACYRTFFAGNLTLPRGPASFNFTDLEPKRLFNLFGVPLTDTNGVSRIVDLAFVSANGAKSSVVVLDITDPTAPTLLASLPVAEDDGLVQSVQRRLDGLLLIGTSANVLVVDPSHLLEPTLSDGTHPAIVSRLPSIGSGAYTFGVTDYGVIAESLGTKSQVLQTAPQLEFVSFPDVAPFNPHDLAGQENIVAERLEHLAVVNGIGPARFQAIDGTVVSTLSPPSSNVHYYVLIHAPGGDQMANQVIDVLLESLNDRGYPLRNKGLGFPPVRAASAQVLTDLKQEPGDCNAPIHPLKAYRLSDQKRSPFYNLYLSEPFALTYENITKDELLALQSELPREILWSGHFIRASLDETVADLNAIGDFAASVDSHRLVTKPGPSVAVESLPADYIMGPNPPPVTGQSVAPGTFGTISAHNGEVRIETVDIALPSRRMPIVFKRTAGAQDLYSGPFGRGWDFNYNQRLIELKASLLDPTANIPLVLRGGNGDEIGRGRDLLFYPGNGRTLLYRFAGTNAPPEIDADPLVQASELNWINTARAYYTNLPNTGTFDFFVRFGDGEFARLEPDGTQYWYGPGGRLERIYDRYEKNYQELTYNQNGELIQITDKSVTTTRFLKLGYWRPADEIQDFTLDRTASDTESYKIGRIGRLKDYTGRDILFDYSPCGELELRQGIAANSGLEPSTPNRAETRYLAATTPSQKANGLRGVVAGSTSGAKLFAADGFNGDPKIPVVSSGDGAAGAVGVNVRHDNTAAAVAAGNASTMVTAADGAHADISFDSAGLPKAMHYSGHDDVDATVQHEYTNGLLKKITYPEGNSITYRYSFNSPILRSRGNLVGMLRDKGGRPGDPMPEATFSYESKYNLPFGAHSDLSGNQIRYELDSHGRDVGTITYIAGAGISPAAGSEEFHYDEDGQLRVHRTIEGFETDFDYDSASGFKISETHVDTGATTFTYTSHASHDGELGLPTQVAPPSGDPIDVTYNEREELTVMDRGGQHEERAYDINGHLVRRSTAVAANQTLVETRHYLQNGFLDNITRHDVETGSGVRDLSFTYVPDAVFRVMEITHPQPASGAPVSTRFEGYDHLGRYHTMREGAYSETYSYDRNGNLLTVVRDSTTDHYEYDGYDRLHFARKDGQSGQEVTERTYYGNGELKSTSVTDGAGLLISQVDFGIDAIGRVTLEERTTDNGIAPTTFNYSGRTLTITDPANETTTVTFDGSGRKTDSNDSVRSVHWTYTGSELSELRSTERGIAYHTFFENYNNLEQYRQLRDDVGILMTMTPRFDGVFTSTTDARGGTTQYNPTKLGEASTRIQPNGVEFHYTFDEHRHLASVTDRQSAGRSYEYDDTLRLHQQNFRAGSPAVVTDYDRRHRQPLTMSIPGGLETFAYDAQARLTGRTVNFTTGSRTETFTRDALERTTSATYPPASSATYQFDKLGPLRRATFAQRGVNYELRDTIRGDGARLTLDYPNPQSLTVTEGRDNAGRLQTVTVSGADPVVSATTFAAANLVGSRTLGPGTLHCDNLYDGRKRLLARTYTAGASNLLAEVRYVYDPTDNVVARQFVHRGGRADFFRYDSGQRLLRADMSVRPQIALAGLRPGYTAFQVPAEVGGAWSPGFFARSFGYDTGNGLDIFTGVTPVNPDALAPTNFATVYGGPDGFLQIGVIDGLARPSDALGGTMRCRLFVRPAGAASSVATNASLSYNGLRELTRVDRDDGVSIEYDYQHDGLCFYRTLTGPGIAGTNETAFIYDGPLLVAEYDRSNGANQLRARYFYSDTDVPAAADIRDGSGVLQRYYPMTDSVGSVMGLVDTNGAVVERYFYDAWGQPEIQTPDHLAPRLRRILTAPDGDGLIAEFTERVLPPLTPALNLNLRATLQDLFGSFQLITSAQTLTPTVIYEESLSGFSFGTALRLRPGVPISGDMTLILQAGRLQDEWANGNAAETNAFTFNSTPGTVLFASDNLPPTDSPPLARSAFGWPFLFHGQYFDYDAGLIYMRARFYDPGSGLFLQQDPDGYQDSVNLYTAFGQNPATMRDPSGHGIFTAAAKEEIEIAEVAARRSAVSGLTHAEEAQLEREIRAVSRDAQSAGIMAHGAGAPERAASAPKASSPHAQPPKAPAGKVAKNGEPGATQNTVDAAAPGSGSIREIQAPKDPTEAFGRAQPPWMVRPGEGKLPPDLQIVAPGGEIKLEKYMHEGNPGKYLYVVDDAGNIRVAREFGEGGRVTKHTDLTGGGLGRVGGEIVPTETSGVWAANSSSGRYSLTPSPEAAKLLEGGGVHPSILQKIKGALVPNRLPQNVQNVDRLWKGANGQIIVSGE